MVQRTGPESGAVQVGDEGAAAGVRLAELDLGGVLEVDVERPAPARLAGWQGERPEVDALAVVERNARAAVSVDDIDLSP